jgi:AmpD protein
LAETVALDGELLVIDAAGWLDSARHCASPNHDARPSGSAIGLIVVHGISLPPGKFGGGYIEQLFQNRLDPNEDDYFREIDGLRVSAHCLVARDGGITQFVSFLDRAWHAGASCWNGRECCNDFSIGIELEGCDDLAYEPVQYRQLARLVMSLRKQYPALQPEAICGHSDIAPGRKTDPGPAFDWAGFKTIARIPL